MKGALANMNFARWIIVIGGVGALALGASGWQLYSKRTEFEEALAPNGRVEAQCKRIQGLGKEYTKAHKDLGGENLKAQDDMTTYITRRAADPRVQLGSVKVIPQQKSEIQKDVWDFKYGIKPQSEDKGQPRDRIANYFYKLESDSRRLRVTNIHMWQEQRLKEWEVGNDLWKWECEVTTRQKEEPKAPK
jgi:hypothetical protein